MYIYVSIGVHQCNNQACIAHSYTALHLHRRNIPDLQYKPAILRSCLYRYIVLICRYIDIDIS